MNDMRLRWSVFPWTRHFDEDRDPVIGAAIHDSRRQVTYRATVNEQGHLDHLEIEMDGYIDDARLARLRSIPRERIESVVAAWVRDYDPDALQFIPEGGLLTDDGDGAGKTPTLERVAELMTRRGWGRAELAIYFDAKERTVDGWIARARAKRREAEEEAARSGGPVNFPEVPSPATGKGYRAKTTDDK
ncbi:hypothetical protein [Antiquaquibacter soli]|uniref:Uncharacterized protein n=1 Tax=Antiquaquibacter soli TaxID=3064523 RepID=A0ABT9BL80_9MICO|nr:hypothetical protein [Protaetiibacter sp. WY-16]MDO7881777.1 hypothetical protein [Protaetiibacter sp. WY-16]